MVALAGLLVSAVCAASQPKVVTIYTNPQVFFSTQDDNGESQGYSIELAQGVVTKAGLLNKVEALPWARLMKLAEVTSASIVVGLVRTPEREANFHWITPVSRNPVAVYTLQTNLKPLNTMDDVAQLESVAVLRDDYRQTLLDELSANNSVAYNTWPQAVKSLLMGRVEGLFLSDMGLALICLNEAMDCSSIEKRYTHQIAVSYIAMAKRPENDLLGRELREAARVYKESEEFRLMAKRYLQQDNPFANLMTFEDGVVSVKP